MSTSILHFHGELAALAQSSRVIRARRPGASDDAAFPSARVIAATSAVASVEYTVTRRASLKDVAESLNVPHSEIYRVTVDGQAAILDRILKPGQSVDLHPGRAPVDVTCPYPPRPALPEPRFLAGANVGRLATYLRVLGFDTAYDRHILDHDAASRAAAEGRVLLTRDRGALRRKIVSWGRLVRANDPLEQTRDVVRFFGLSRLARPFTLCARCNLALESVPKADVLNLLEPKTRLYYHDFSRCPACQRVYWAGSHHGHMAGLVDKIVAG
jgi:hypothetical protein